MAKVLETLTKRLELPGELLSGVPRLTLTGSDSVLVENHGELLSYTDELLELGCGRLRLRIRGEGLLLRAMDGEQLLVTGRIFGVEVDGA